MTTLMMKLVVAKRGTCSPHPLRTCLYRASQKIPDERRSWELAAAQFLWSPFDQRQVQMHGSS